MTSVTLSSARSAGNAPTHGLHAIEMPLRPRGAVPVVLRHALPNEPEKSHIIKGLTF